jgi:hypothetical protein
MCHQAQVQALHETVVKLLQNGDEQIITVTCRVRQQRANEIDRRCLHYSQDVQLERGSLWPARKCQKQPL